MADTHHDMYAAASVSLPQYLLRSYQGHGPVKTLGTGTNTGDVGLPTYPIRYNLKYAAMLTKFKTGSFRNTVA